MNRAQRIDAATRIAEDFLGKLVDCNIRVEGELDLRGVQRPVAALKARKTPRDVELVVSHAWRGDGNRPEAGIRVLQVVSARLDPDDHVWTVKDGSGRAITLEVASTADAAFNQYRADPDLVAFAVVEIGKYIDREAGVAL